MDNCAACEIVELRQYTLMPGSTAAFIELFEDHLFAPQEALGMRLLGIFTRPDADDKFVWLRGFPARAGRKHALEEFYYGPVWKRYRERANGMMIDSDDVHLLRPMPGRPTLEDLIAEAPDRESPTPFALTVTPGSVGGAQLDRNQTTAVLETEPTVNDFPQLPVRATDVRVSLRRLADSDAPGTDLVELTPTRRSRLR
jgi:NIPSNAP